MKEYIFTSERLGFRNWLDEDLPTFAALNSDPVVMEYFPKTLNKEQSQSMVCRMKKHFEDHGYGLYAVDKLENSEFIGFIGFMKPSFDAYFMPCTEIGWRLKKAAWNKGYATEGAKRCLEFGFEELKLSKIYSFTATPNIKSERVMQKIGMQKIGEFEHPGIENGNWLKTHVLYKSENGAEKA